MSKLKKFQKSLRLSQPKAEQLLWKQLRHRQIGGYKFRRQQIIQGYIVDFVCLEKKLIIELDGGQHAQQVEYDAERTRRLEKDGFRVLRFWNNSVFIAIKEVLETIYNVLDSPSPAASRRPLPRGER